MIHGVVFSDDLVLHSLIKVSKTKMSGVQLFGSAEAEVIPWCSAKSWIRAG